VGADAGTPLRSRPRRKAGERGRPLLYPAAVPRTALAESSPGFGLVFSSIQRCLSSSSPLGKRKTLLASCCAGAPGLAATQLPAGNIWLASGRALSGAWPLQPPCGSPQPHEDGIYPRWRGAGACPRPGTHLLATTDTTRDSVSPSAHGQRCQPALKPALGSHAWWEGSVHKEAAVPSSALWDLLVQVISWEFFLCCVIAAGYLPRSPDGDASPCKSAVLLAPQTASPGPCIPSNRRKTWHKPRSSPASRAKSHRGSVSPGTPGPVAPGLVLCGEHRSAASRRSGGIHGRAPGFPFLCSFFFCLVPSCLDPPDRGVRGVTRPN